MLTSLSEQRLKTCDSKLQQLVRAVEATTPLVVLVGYRGPAEQDQAFHDGLSKLKWPTSHHNKSPSQAVDLAPLPIDWNDVSAFTALADTVKAKALELGIRISWGGDWITFKDYDHFQLG